MVKAVIVEDTLDNRETLKRILAAECPMIHVEGEAEDAEQGYVLIKEVQPDLVFLDIQLDKETTFDLLERLHNEDAVNFEIIFITGYGTFENATRAIAFSALDFITKPIEEEKLVKAVEKVNNNIKQKHNKRQVELLLEHLQRPTSKKKRIAFHLLKGIVEFLEVDHIVRCEADGAVTHVYLKDGTKLTAMKNLGYYSRLLSTDYNFFQISNDMLINLDYVKRYNHAELAVTFTDGTYVYASRRGGQQFRKLLSDTNEYSDIEKSEGLLKLLKKLLGG